MIPNNGGSLAHGHIQWGHYFSLHRVGPLATLVGNRFERHTKKHNLSSREILVDGSSLYRISQRLVVRRLHARLEKNAFFSTKAPSIKMKYQNLERTTFWPLFWIKNEDGRKIAVITATHDPQGVNYGSHGGGRTYTTLARIVATTRGTVMETKV